MMEMIRNAWLGWQDYKEGGKIAALLLLGLLFLWFTGKWLKSRFSTLIIYTTVMVLCCICPLTAAALMSYQTKFYDYQWIWNMVPVTIMVALAGTLIWSELMKKYGSQKGLNWKSVGITAAIFAVIYLSGSMGNPAWDMEEETRKKEETANVLEIITENGQNIDITLWAPKEIMEYARALYGNIRLPYGRNMWDIALNAYSYDTYGEAENTLYAWMSHAEETGEGKTEIGVLEDSARRKTITVTDCVELAKQLGITHVLLPGNLQPETLAELQDCLDTQTEEVSGFYLFHIG